MKSYIQISIRTKIDTSEVTLGERLIGSLLECGDYLAPEQVSHNADRITEPFSVAAQDAFQEMWASVASLRANGSLFDFYQDFAWRRKRAVKSSGTVSHTLINARGQLVPGNISFRAQWSRRVDWYSLFKSWCGIFPPQLAMLHLFDGPELSPERKNNSFQIGSFNSALHPDIPGIAWAMFYGNEFADEVDLRSLVNAGFQVDGMGGGHLVRVTEDIGDVSRNFGAFFARRAQLRKLFREGFFLENASV